MSCGTKGNTGMTTLVGRDNHRRKSAGLQDRMDNAMVVSHDGRQFDHSSGPGCEFEVILVGLPRLAEVGFHICRR